jgi:hypothetical protein
VESGHGDDECNGDFSPITLNVRVRIRRTTVPISFMAGKQKSTPHLEILSGWKDIANHLGMGVRTVQRYERELGLPVIMA